MDDKDREIAELRAKSQQSRGTPYKDMTPKQKVIFVLKLAVCIMTFGLAFPNVGD